MLIDSSVVVAIYKRESGYSDLIKTLSASRNPLFSAVSFLETSMVLKDDAWLKGFLDATAIAFVSFSMIEAEETAAAFYKYGKGRHPAALNFGDCVVYGTAKANGLHVLHRGDDFSRTDITSVAVHGEEGS